MNRHVNAIAGRLGLRATQRESLEILDRVAEFIPPRKGADVAEALDVVRSEFPPVTDFERDFLPSFCFALATGVGNARLTGGARRVDSAFRAVIRCRRDGHLTSRPV